MSQRPLCAVLVLLSACNATIIDPGARSGTPPPELELDGGIDVTPEQCADAPGSVGSTPLRRLTQAQYRNTLLDTLGLEALPAAPAARLLDVLDGQDGGFTSSSEAPVGETLRNYVALAEELAGTVVEAQTQFVSCDLADRACVGEFIATFGRRAFRRPLEDSEVTHYLTVYDSFFADGEGIALETMVASMLASPNFLYRAEPVVPTVLEDRRIGITPFALASRLSYFLWNGPPDEALLDRAESGNLSTDADIAEVVTRMMDDDKALRGIESFYTQWMHIDRLSESEAGPSLIAAMTEETARFTSEVTLNGTIEELFTADYTYGNEELAMHYGAGMPDAEGRMELDPSERSGILTHASFLARFGVVYPEVHRGHWVRANALCDSPPPPGEVPQEGATYRLANEPCRTCHLQMDLIGFGFSDFDSLGRYRPEENPDRGVQPDPELYANDLDLERSGRFDSARELGEMIGDSVAVSDCFSLQMFRFAMGRPERSGDACGIRDMRSRLTAAGGDIRTLLVDIATSPEFSHRSISALEER